MSRHIYLHIYNNMYIYIYMHSMYIVYTSRSDLFFPPSRPSRPVDGHDHAERFDHGHRGGDLEPQQRRSQAGAGGPGPAQGRAR